jgi:hypothetical protein
MAVLEGGVSAALMGVGAEPANAGHMQIKPIAHGSLGHYRTGVKLVFATTQAANSRLFEIRNTSTNILVLTRCFVMVAPAGTITTPYMGEIGLFRLTGFTAVDTTNTVTPVASVKRTSGMAAYPGGAAVRHVTLAGAAAGMTGGTLTKDTQALGSLLFNGTTFAAGTVPFSREFVDDTNGTHPLVMAQNEGFELENVVVGSGTANVVHCVIDISWAEVTAY